MSYYVPKNPKFQGVGVAPEKFQTVAYQPPNHLNNSASYVGQSPTIHTFDQQQQLKKLCCGSPSDGGPNHTNRSTSVGSPDLQQAYSGHVPNSSFRHYEPKSFQQPNRIPVMPIHHQYPFTKGGGFNRSFQHEDVTQHRRRGGFSQQSHAHNNYDSARYPFHHHHGGGEGGGGNRNNNWQQPLSPNQMPFTSWDSTTNPPIIGTEAYEEHPEVASLTPQDIQAMYRDMEVVVTGTSPPRPSMELHQAPFPKWIVDILYQIGFSKPYPVQSVGWPAVLQSRDMIGIAKTGSGKTLAYLLPGIVHIQKQSPLKPGDGPIALILAPTRELAMQIEREARRFASPATSLSVICVYGGVARSRQASALSRGVHICIATPGRLLDFLDSNTTNLRRVTYLVLDEADRMLDMGFEPQIRRVAAQIRPDRQTLMWSATWPKAIQQLARDLCRAAPIRVTVGTHDLQANENIRQIVEVCGAQGRFALLLDHLRLACSQGEGPGRKALVFCETKRSCDVLCDRIRCGTAGRDFNVTTIHGDKEQVERDRALTDFKQGHCNVLIATDVASRGLDIKGIDLVVNYDIPKTIECYIHRIGRTGRAGAMGTAVSLLSDAVSETERIRMAKEIAVVMQDVGQIPPIEVLKLAAASNYGSSSSTQRGRGGRGGRGRFPRGGGGGGGGGGLRQSVLEGGQRQQQIVGVPFVSR